MTEKDESLVKEIKNILKVFRGIGENPLLISNMNIFSYEMQLLIDYAYSGNIYEDREMFDLIKKDFNTPGIFTPLGLLLNPVNIVTKIEKKIKKVNHNEIITEEKNLVEMLSKTAGEISAIQEEGKENNRQYMEAPVKINRILDEMNIGQDASRKITEMISALIMEIRSYKLDHSRVFIKLEKIKEERRSLTKEERVSLDLDEILKKQKEIKTSTDSLLLRLNDMIKKTNSTSDVKDKVSQLNYILKDTIEVLPTIDYDNIKSFDKLVTNLERFKSERTACIKRSINDNSEYFKKLVTSIVNLIYNEVIWDRDTKKLKISTGDLMRGPLKVLKKEDVWNKLSSADPRFFSSFINIINPPCRILIMQNPGRSFFHKELGVIVIHNYLFSFADECADIAEAFASALLALSPEILKTFMAEFDEKYFKVNSETSPEALFTKHYVSCFLERFSSVEPGGNDWVEFCRDNPALKFFTTRYFRGNR